MSRKVIIMRGPSGSGKSTFVKKYFPLAPVFSADSFFERLVLDPNPHWVYEFNPKKIAEAHSDCFNRFTYSVFAKYFETLVVDNTNSQKWEYQNYVLVAEVLGWDVKIITTMNPLQMSAEELSIANVHGVPAEVIQSMMDRYEPHSEDIHVDLYDRYNP